MNRRKERMGELSRLPRNTVIDRILEYPDQDLLNKNQRFPIGTIAGEIRDHNYRMTTKQYDALRSSFVNVTNAQVTAKEQELEPLSRRELIDRICSYPDQAHLNYFSNGEKQTWPVGERAERIREKGYKMTPKQHASILRSFAELTAGETKEMEQARAPRTIPETKETRFARTVASRTSSETAFKPCYQEYRISLSRCRIREGSLETVNERLKGLQDEMRDSVNQWIKEFEEEPMPEITSVSYTFSSGTEGIVRMESAGEMPVSGVRQAQDWVSLANISLVPPTLKQMAKEGLVQTEPGWNPSFRMLDQSFQKQGALQTVPDLALSDADLAGLSDEDSLRL